MNSSIEKNQDHINEIKMAFHRVKWNTVATVFDKVVSFLLTPLLAYRFMPDQIGFLSLMLIVGFYVNTLSDMGLANAAGREVSKTKDVLLARYTMTYRSLSLVAIVILGAVILPWIHVEAKTFAFIILMLIASVGTSYNLSWFYLSIDKAHWTVVINLTKSGFLLFGTFFFVKRADDLNKLAVIFILAHSAYAILNFYLLQKFSGGIFCTMKQFKELWSRFMKSAFINCVLLFLILIYNSIDTVLLSYLSDLSSAGFYNIGAKIPKTAQEAIFIFGAGLFPSLVRWSDRKRNLEKIVSNMITLFSLIVLPPVLLIGLFSEKLTLFLFSSSFYNSWMILYLLAPCVILFFINNTFRMIAIASSHEKYAMRITLVGLLINIGLNVVFIPLYQELGCIVALFVSEVLMAFAYNIVFKRHLGISISIAKSLLLVFGSYTFLWFAKGIMHLHEFVLLVGVVLFSVLLLLLNREWIFRMVSDYLLPKRESELYV